MKKIVWVVFFILLSACKTNPANETTKSISQSTADPFRIMNTIPFEYQQDVVLAQAFGTEIFFQDIAAWVTTDFLSDKGVLKSDRRLRGWITEHLNSDPNDFRMKVTFVGEVNGKYLGFYQVQVDYNQVIADTYRVFPDGVSLTPEQQAMFAARQTALQTEFSRCSQNYNTAVIRFSDDDARYHIVYLLTASVEAGIIPAGGNHKITLNDSGEKVLKTLALSKSCLTLNKREGAVGLTMTHITTPTPTAVHVFLSLMNDIPFYVLTTDNEIVWKVNGNQISILRDKKAREN